MLNQEVIYFVTKNLFVYFGVYLIMVAIHEKGHYFILKATGANPIIKIDLFKGSKTTARIPKDRAKEIQCLSAINAITYGYFVYVTYMLFIIMIGQAYYFMPATLFLWITYIFGIQKDVVNIFKWYKTK